MIVIAMFLTRFIMPPVAVTPLTGCMGATSMPGLFQAKMAQKQFSIDSSRELLRSLRNFPHATLQASLPTKSSHSRSP